MSELAGRVALVTGGSRNIGRVIALELAAAGADVAIVVRSSREAAEKVAGEIKTLGRHALVHLCDLTAPKETAAMVDAVERAFGRLDILVNNAAVRAEATIDELDYDEWKRVVSACVDPAFLCTKACLKLLRASGQGAVINLGGLTAHTGAKNRAHVVAGKAAVVGLTRALAHDLADDKITVNCLSPGFIATERGGTSPVAPAHHATRHPLTGRRGTSEEVAAAVRYLVGPAARYTTGQVIHINGGLYLGG
jgi:3-oxoacyl-[acyl-carrier protein] reductase